MKRSIPFAFAVLAASACAAGVRNAAPTTTTQPPAENRPFLGMSVPGSRFDLIQSTEADLDHRIELIRWFRRWDDDLVDPSIDEVAANGRRIHLSVRPVASDGRVVPWRSLADAVPGDPVHAELLAWVDRMVALPEGSYVTLNHEPETRESAANGTADDFRAMWRRWSGLLAERGGADLRTVWVMTGGAFSDGRAEQWYPGDDVVDVIGADPYNWYTCQGTTRPWVPFADLIAAPLAFARSHTKPLALPEFGSVEDPARPGRKAQWILDATAVLTDESVAPDLEFVSWFNVTAPGGTYPDCIWDYDTSPESADAFRAMVRSVGDG